MDTSEPFFNMCIRAFKYIGITSDGGEFIMKPLDPPKKWPGKGLLLASHPGNTPVIGQLYRQDQLQEMINTEIDIPYGQLLIDVFYKWIKETYKPYPFMDNSITWEQLWLAFVMKEKYNKVWNGEDWIKKE